MIDQVRTSTFDFKREELLINWYNVDFTLLAIKHI